MVPQLPGSTAANVPFSHDLYHPCNPTTLAPCAHPRCAYQALYKASSEARTRVAKGARCIGPTCLAFPASCLRGVGNSSLLPTSMTSSRGVGSRNSGTNGCLHASTSLSRSWRCPPSPEPSSHRGWPKPRASSSSTLRSGTRRGTSRARPTPTALQPSHTSPHTSSRRAPAGDAGVPQGRFRGLRSRGANAKMPFALPICTRLRTKEETHGRASARDCKH